MATKTNSNRTEERKFEKLMQRIASGEQDIDLRDFSVRAELDDDWDWSDVMSKYDFETVMHMIQAGLR